MTTLIVLPTPTPTPTAAPTSETGGDAPDAGAFAALLDAVMSDTDAAATPADGATGTPADGATPDPLLTLVPPLPDAADATDGAPATDAPADGSADAAPVDGLALLLTSGAVLGGTVPPGAPSSPMPESKPGAAEAHASAPTVTGPTTQPSSTAGTSAPSTATQPTTGEAPAEATPQSAGKATTDQGAMPTEATRPGGLAGSGFGHAERNRGRAGPEHGERPVGSPEATEGEKAGATAAGLLELGVPVRLLEGFANLTDPVPLSMLVRRFERPPAVRLEPGATVVVVGSGEHALRVASQMAGRAGLDGRDVLLAGEIESVAGHGRRLLTVAAAARHRSRRRTDVPTVVALGVGAGMTAQSEAATLLAALEPDQAWAVVDARLRVGEMRRLVRAVGAQREVDALAVVGTQEAQAPGVVLDVGVPVGWVDGLPATALVWAALLSERLADDADWD